MNDTISRQAAIEEIDKMASFFDPYGEEMISKYGVKIRLEFLKSVKPERVWTSCDIPPEHHRDVIVRGIEAIGNVTVHKVMQWDVDTWRPTNYAPSITWLDWSEI